MNYTNLAIAIMGMAVLWHVTATIMIYQALRKRSYKVSFLLLRLLAPKYASQYRKITKEETGKTGRAAGTAKSDWVACGRPYSGRSRPEHVETESIGRCCLLDVVGREDERGVQLFPKHQSAGEMDGIQGLDDGWHGKCRTA